MIPPTSPWIDIIIIAGSVITLTTIAVWLIVKSYKRKAVLKARKAEKKNRIQRDIEYRKKAEAEHESFNARQDIIVQAQSVTAHHVTELTLIQTEFVDDVRNINERLSSIRKQYDEQIYENEAEIIASKVSIDALTVKVDKLNELMITLLSD